MNFIDAESEPEQMCDQELFSHSAFKMYLAITICELAKIYFHRNVQRSLMFNLQLEKMSSPLFD